MGYSAQHGLIYDGVERNPKGPGTHNHILTYYSYYCLGPSGKDLERNPRTCYGAPDWALDRDVRFPLFRTNHIQR